MYKKLFFLAIMAIGLSVAAQDCNLFIPLEQNKGLQYQNFNRRDRLESTQDIMIREVIHHDNKTEAVVSSKFYDSRDRFLHEGEYSVFCSGDKLVMDMSALFDQEMMQTLEHVSVNMVGDGLTIPNTISVGDELPDAQLDMELTANNVKISDIKILTQNRKVEEMESITTPAGTFECYKVTYKNIIRTHTLGMTVSNNSKVIEYFAPGVGSVRTEFYDDRDRLQSYTVLSKIY